MTAPASPPRSSHSSRVAKWSRHATGARGFDQCRGAHGRHFRAAGHRLDLKEFDAIGRSVPVLVDSQASERAIWASSMLPAACRASVRTHRSPGSRRARALAAHSATAWPTSPRAMRPRSFGAAASRSPAMERSPFSRAIWRRAAPSIKHSAADPALLVHEGTCVVFDGVKDMSERLDSPELAIAADGILVLRNAGPKGLPHARAATRPFPATSPGRASRTWCAFPTRA